MKSRKIKVYPKEVINVDFVRYPYSVAKIKGEFRFLKAAIDMHVKDRANEYFN